MKLSPRTSFCRSFYPALTFVMLLIAISGSAQIPAFPGALGFGANVTGGRGGVIYHVTTLADSGTGSFRDAVSHSGRIIVFDVGGYVNLKTAVSCSGNLTIAGQTAPGGGIGFYGGEISFSSRSNVVCRYIRIRPGSLTSSTDDDALALADARTMIFDHCSFEFGPWNNVDAVSDDWQTTPVTEITFQNCLDADPIGQQFGAHTESVSSTMTWVYSIFANSHNRNPLAKINNVFVNNVLYNCSAGYTTHTSTTFNHDMVNNYFISGPATGDSSDFPWFQVDDNQSIFYSGNYFDSNENGSLDGSMTTPYWYQGGTGTILTSPWSPVTTTIPTYSVATAFRLDVSQAGTLPHDQMDNLVMSQMQTLGSGTTGTGVGTTGPDGGLYTSQTQTGLGNSGYGVINGAIGPIDSDGDGMPDYWERAMGLNYLSASDATTMAPDGYMNIEHYLNWLGGLHALTATNTAVDVDLWQYTIGFTNASPVFSVGNGSNGVVTLTGGHIAHFVPAANFYGLAAFQFSVVTADSSYTDTVSTVVTPMQLSFGVGASLTWAGDGVSNIWDAGVTTNWFNGTNNVAFNPGDMVTFDDSGADAPAINLSGSLSAGAINVIADEQDYTFGGAGVLSGLATMYKVGAGNLFINTTNTFSGGVTIQEGNVQLGDGISANGSIVGNITNNDTLIYANPGTLASSVNISGSGVLIKNAPGSLTLSGTQTYTNLTTINAGTLQFSGTVPASDMVDNGSLIFAPASLNYGNAISGSGPLTAAATGIMLFSGANTFTGNLTNNSGVLVLSNNQAAGAGAVVYNAGYVVVGNGITITNNYNIPGSADNDLCMMATNTGTGIWAGNVIIAGSGQWRPGSDGGTLEFLGSAVMGSHIFLVPRGAMIFASNAVVSSTVSGFLGRDSSGNKRSLNLTVRDNASVAMAGCSFGGGKVGSSVTITVQNNAVLNLGSTVDLHNIANSAAVSTVRLNGGTFIAGGFTKTDTSYTNIIDFNGGTLKAYAGNTAFLPAFTATTSTNLVQAGGAIIDDGGFAITIAAVLLHDPALGTTPDAGLTKLDTGTLTLTASETYTGPTLVNAGTLALSGSGAIAGSTNLYVGSGAIFDASGTASGGFTLGAGHTLFGNGSINGNFTVGAVAIVAPGSNLIGALTFNNALTLAAGSTNIFAVSHLPLTNDTANVAGALTINGTLIITNSGANALAAGDTFKLFAAASYSGTFSNIILPSLNAGLAWNTNALNTAGMISVVSTALVTPPDFGNLSISGSSLIFSGSNGMPSANFYLLTTTNLATPLTNWTRLLTNQFDGNGNFNFTNPAGTNPGSFYRLQLP